MSVEIGLITVSQCYFQTTNDKLKVHIKQLRRPHTEKCILNHLFTKIAQKQSVPSIPGTQTRLNTTGYIQWHRAAQKKKRDPVEIWQEPTEGSSRFKRHKSTENKHD